MLVANSLQQQLLKAGLVDKKKANKLKAEQLQKKQKVKKGKLTAEDAEAQKNNLQAEREAKKEKDKQLNKALQNEQQKKAVHAQIRQMIEINRVAKEEGDVAYHFKDGKSIKKLYMSDAMQHQLSVGVLAIAKLDNAYELVPEPVADKIKQRDDSYILVCNTRQDSAIDEDDPYADFKIPDDLMW
ncbi:DUF2058 domain-containing protein [Marinomonas agarivorans]|nr:DUF2058 domain-containing protein [Marinomonas agarivorans]